MKKKFSKYDDEIDLIQVAKNLWENKWKIFVVIIISVIVFFIFQITDSKPSKSFTAITQVLPITSSQESYYATWNNTFSNNYNLNAKTENESFIFNGVNFNKINKELLLQNFIDVLNERKLFIEGMHKYKLLDVNQYKNEETYNRALEILASLIKFEAVSKSIEDPHGSTDLEKKMISSQITNMLIKFQYNDKQKWYDVLRYVDREANKIVRKRLINQFTTLMLILEKNKQHELEDISIKIDNLINDYDRKMSNRLSYLTEQSAIAKRLGISKNTFEVQTFGSQNALLSTIQTDSPFYLRGYEAIDKEIELINLRTDKQPFIEGLLPLEQQKRGIEQEKFVERLKFNLEGTPLMAGNQFRSAEIKTFTTIFNNKKENKTEIKLPIFILFGLIFGILYVLIVNAFQAHNSQRNK